MGSPWAPWILIAFEMMHLCTFGAEYISVEDDKFPLAPADFLKVAQDSRPVKKIH